MPRSNQREGTIGYVLKRFPVLSETFILNEILALERQGVPIHIFSLERPNDPRFHEDLPKLKAQISYVPDMMTPKTLLHQAQQASKVYKGRYRDALAYTATKVNPSLMYRFLQACYVANHARRLGIGRFHAHFATRPTTVACLAARITGLPYTFTAHAMDIFKENLSKKALERKIRDAELVVTVSEYNRAYLAQFAGEQPEKILRIYNGIDLTKFSPNGVFTPPTFTMLCVARLVEKKGLPTLVEACKILRDRGVSFRCLIVGKGALRTRLESLINELQLQDAVSLLGALSQLEVRDRYREAQLFVLPCTTGADGNRDGLPVSIVEALACGLPVVSTPVTGIPEVVKHGINGLLVPVDSPVALADALQRAIEDASLYDHLRRNARFSVACDFDMDRTTTQLNSLFSGAPVS